MAIEQEIQSALDSENPALALRNLVIGVHKDGVSKKAICHKLHWFSQSPDISEAAEDDLFDVLDTLVGFCSPHRRLIPDEPDVII